MEQKMVVMTILILVGWISVADSAKILAIIPSPFSSHQSWNRALIAALLERGHNMTVLSAEVNVESSTNKKEIQLKGSHDLIKTESFHQVGASRTYFGMMFQLWRRGIEICNHQLHAEGALELLRMSPDAFDLILIDTIMNDCFYLYIHHFGGGIKIPVVGLSAVGTGPWTDEIMGVRNIPSVSPLYILPYESHMTLWQRYYNTALTLFHSLGFAYYYLPAQQKIAEEMYGKQLPPLSDLGRNISIILTNNHPGINGLQFKPPGIMEVGGLHCDQSKTLPLNILKFVNKAEKGIIYVSFGSTSDRLHEVVEQSMIDAFAAIGPRIRVLWKYDPSFLPAQLPTNILVQNWMPQKDILGHPKTLLFVSHGGLLSVQEAIYHGMPVVGIPLSGEQDQNIKHLVHSGAAVKLGIDSLNKGSLQDAITTILRNTSFRRKMHKLSSTFRDQPEHPLDKAIFWTEYALRQRTGYIEHFHLSSKELSWFAYYMADIFILLTFQLVFCVGMLYYAYKTIQIWIVLRDMRRIFKSSKKGR